MAILDPSDLSFDGEQIKSISEAVFTSGFAKPEVTQFHEVVTGIVATKQIAILGRINELVGLGSNACDPSATPITITNTEKTWSPVDVSDRFEFCWTDLKETFFIWGLKKGIDKPDLTSTDFALWVEELLVDVIWECVYRIVWFNDTDAALVTASPAGVITAGTTIGHFNKLDGFFKQLFAIVSADPDRLTSGFTAVNGGASYTLQKFDAADTTNRLAITTLQNMEFDADLRLRDDDSRVYIVTQSIADQLKRELVSISMQYEIEKVTNGISVITFDGKTVYVFSFWDRIIRTYFDNGTTTYLPHRAIMVNPIDLQVGTEGEKQLDELKIWYNMDKKKTVIDFAFSIDAKFIRDEMVQMAH